MSRIRNLSIASTPALAGIVGPLILVTGDIAATLSIPDYSMVRDTISSLALTHLGWLQTLGFLVMGLMVQVFIAGLYLSIRKARGFGPSIGLLMCLGFGLLMIGAFRMDPPGVPPTTEGTIHTITAYSLSLVFPIALLSLAPSLRSDPNWRATFVYTLIAAVLALGLTAGLVLLSARMAWFGLYERIIVANLIIWVEVMAVHLLRLSLRRKPLPEASRGGRTNSGM
ncbi:MAG: DUF998 domain-containing protein [Dehalococcoidia bacterium]